MSNTKLNNFLLCDELPLWSAPFGLVLLEIIRLRKHINILDIGSGAGFPMLEIAERAGKTCSVYGIDPSPDSILLITEKIKLKKIKNASILGCCAEDLPFPENNFGLVANNGLNNVRDEKRVLSECYRVMDKGAQMVLTMNLPDTFFEFYDVFEAVLKRKGQEEELTRMKEHIFAKRKPVEYWKKVILAAGFRIRSINIAEFKLSFLNGTAFLNHSFIRTAFLGPWEAITSDPEIFDAIQATLNYQAGKRGQLTMTVPYVCMDCFKD